MSYMAINSTSLQLSATYASSMTKTEPVKKELIQEQLDGAVRRDFDWQKPYEDSWQELWGAQLTQTVAEDGTVTQTLSGSVSVCGAGSGFNYRGVAAFSVSVTFDSSSYEMGQLGSTVDLMAAAYEVQKYALQSAFSGQELADQASRLTALYQTRKDEAAKSFSDMVGGLLEARGQSGQTQKIYDSVQALFLSYEAKYQSVAVSSPSGWMKASLFESVISLQRLGASVQAGSVKQDGLYTLRELELTAAGVRGSLNTRV